MRRRAILTVGLVCLIWLWVSERSDLLEVSGAAGSDDKPSGEVATASDAKETKVAAGKDNDSDKGKVRKFTFHYRFRVKGLPVDADNSDRVRVWMPCPCSNDHQQVTRLDATVPGELLENVEPRFDNRILYFQTRIPPSGEFTVDVPYRVIRHEVRRAQPSQQKQPAISLDRERRERFLSADRLVPITGKPLKLLGSIEAREDKLGLARRLYDLVDDHVAYKKEGAGWGRGDTNWVCDSGYGNCTDFHSLFISLARSQGIPARFEIGFSIPTDKSEGPIAGYHCWAWFHVDDQGWIPVDISEADKSPQLKEYYFGNLTADRVLFSTGRDLKLEPKTSAEPLNFFIHPYIEVNGKAWPFENVELQHSFRI